MTFIRKMQDAAKALYTTQNSKLETKESAVGFKNKRKIGVSKLYKKIVSRHDSQHDKLLPSKTIKSRMIDINKKAKNSFFGKMVKKIGNHSSNNASKQPDSQTNIEQSPRETLKLNLDNSDSIANNILDNKEEGIYLANKNLNDIYLSSLEVSNKEEGYKILNDFLQAIPKEYTVDKLPTAEEKQSLYKAYTTIAGNYLCLLGCSKDAQDPTVVLKKNKKKPSLETVATEKKQLSEKASFLDIIHTAEQNKDFLEKQLDDISYVSAAVTGLGSVGLLLSNFVYEDCLGIYFKADPNLQLADAYKARNNVINKNPDNKDEKLKQIDENIKAISDTLSYIKNKGLATQKDLARDVFTISTDRANKTLAKKITQHIKNKKLQGKDVSYITDSIVAEYNKDLKQAKTTPNKLGYARELIETEVNIWKNPLESDV